MNYPKTSPYYFSSVYNNQFLDAMVNRPIPTLETDLYWEITQTYNIRPDLLAYDLYSDNQLWWVFAIRNRSIIKDPVFDMVAGVKIFLPKATTLKRVVG